MTRVELWDAYDEGLQRIEGVSLIRSERIPSGMFHLVCDVLVRHTDGSWLIMLRDFRKPLGGKWEATAGGPALQGESPLECARRELSEETGITTGILTEAGRETNPVNQTHYVEYLCVTDCDKDGVTLQDGETVAHRWISKAELTSMPRDVLASDRILKYIDELKPPVS